MLSLKNLSIKADEKLIVSNFDLEVKPGEIHCIMGPNGSGKSTLVNALMGHPKYEITAEECLFDGENLAELEAFERARKGLFLAQQYPKEIPGVNFLNFLTAAYNGVRAELDDFKPLKAFKMKKLVTPLLEELGIKADFLNRYINHGFSGGEKKKAEILQLKLLDPKLALLDETDSGLDVDALKIVGEGVNSFVDDKKAVIVVTHYQRILEYIKPDFVHVIKDGKKVLSGGPELAAKLEKEGFNWL